MSLIIPMVSILNILSYIETSQLCEIITHHLKHGIAGMTKDVMLDTFRSIVPNIDDIIQAGDYMNIIYEFRLAPTYISMACAAQGRLSCLKFLYYTYAPWDITAVANASHGYIECLRFLLHVDAPMDTYDMYSDVANSIECMKLIHIEGNTCPLDALVACVRCGNMECLLFLMNIRSPDDNDMDDFYFYYSRDDIDELRVMHTNCFKIFMRYIR